MQGDPFKTLFVGRLSYDVTEKKLRREFEEYGPINSVSIVHNIKSGALPLLSPSTPFLLKAATAAALSGQQLQQLLCMSAATPGRCVQTRTHRVHCGALSAGCALLPLVPTLLALAAAAAAAAAAAFPPVTPCLHDERCSGTSCKRRTGAPQVMAPGNRLGCHCACTQASPAGTPSSSSSTRTT
jgi:RNA recognition motif. (a.k.a. RRM, RBD, or RNP domain)